MYWSLGFTGNFSLSIRLKYSLNGLAELSKLFRWGFTGFVDDFGSLVIWQLALATDNEGLGGRSALEELLGIIPLTPVLPEGGFGEVRFSFALSVSDAPWDYPKRSIDLLGISGMNLCLGFMDL